MLPGCRKNINQSDISACDELQYWEGVSNNHPYPGMNCYEGPSKSVGITIFVYKDYAGENYISNPDSIPKGIETINEVFNPHGINLELYEIIYINQPFPDPEDIQENEDDTSIEYGQSLSYKNLGVEFRLRYNKNTINMVMTTDDWGAYSMFPWPDKTYYVTMVRASTFAGSYIPAHELGHFFGLLHTHANSTGEDSLKLQGLTPVNSPGHWVEPREDCYIFGDFICDNAYDCYNFCEEVLGCSGSYLYEEDKPDGVENQFSDCGPEYTPPLENLMSRYGARKNLSLEQGARARYFLMYRLNQDINGNILQLIREGV